MKKYNVVFVAGTFDHFHSGHANLISKAIALGNTVIIGITSDLYVTQKKANFLIESFDIRKESVKKYIKSQKKIVIIAIDNALEPAISDSTYDAILISSGTYEGALLINEKRKQNKLHTLEIITIPMVFAEDGMPISSTRIRNGEINRDGQLFIKPEWLTEKFVIPYDIREQLKIPWGNIIELTDKTLKNFNPESLISVGDVSTLTLHKLGIKPSLSILDFIVERKKKFSSIQELGFSGKEVTITIDNKPGTINGDLFEIISKSIKSARKHFIIKINGEEDLAVLPAILVAPLCWGIVYGQPKKGLVFLYITEELKKRAYSIILASKTIR